MTQKIKEWLQFIWLKITRRRVGLRIVETKSFEETTKEEIEPIRLEKTYWIVEVTEGYQETIYQKTINRIEDKEEVKYKDYGEPYTERTDVVKIRAKLVGIKIRDSWFDMLSHLSNGEYIPYLRVPKTPVGKKFIGKDRLEELISASYDEYDLSRIEELGFIRYDQPREKVISEFKITLSGQEDTILSRAKL